jgi:metal-responsive CopG/Arc/MetJ family transcriptional regulator
MKEGTGNLPVRRSVPAGFCLEKSKMTEITVRLPPDVVARIDELREVELLSRSNWLRREVVLAVRETLKPSLARMEPEGVA